MVDNANRNNGGLYSKWNHTDLQSPSHALAQKLTNLTQYDGCNYFSPILLEKLEQAFLIAASIKLGVPDDFCLLSTKSADALKKTLLSQSFETVNKINKCFAEYSKRKILDEVKFELQETLAHVSYIASLEEREAVNFRCCYQYVFKKY